VLKEHYGMARIVISIVKVDELASICSNFVISLTNFI